MVNKEISMSNLELKSLIVEGMGNPDEIISFYFVKS